MNFKYIVLIIVGLIILVLMNGCERGVGREPVAVKNVTANNLIGTWVLSQKYTDKRVLQKLKHNIHDYYFILKSNKDLEYHSFYPRHTAGEWTLNSDNLKLEYFCLRYNCSKPYSDFKKAKTLYYKHGGGYMTNKNIPKNEDILLQYLTTLRVTKKNNKLLLWRYEGDPDARRYIMYEKKE